MIFSGILLLSKGFPEVFEEVQEVLQGTLWILEGTAMMIKGGFPVVGSLNSIYGSFNSFQWSLKGSPDLSWGSSCQWRSNDHLRRSGLLLANEIIKEVFKEFDGALKRFQWCLRDFSGPSMCSNGLEGVPKSLE